MSTTKWICAAVALVCVAAKSSWAMAGSLGSDERLPSWEVVTPMLFAVRSPAAATDGERIFVFGGTDRSGVQTTHTQIFDPQSATWTMGSPMPEPAAFLATADGENAIHVVGGLRAGVGTLRVHRLYRPSTDSWEVLPSMPTALHGSTVEALNGRLYVLGGVATGGRNYTDEVWVYDLARPAWSVGEHLPGARLNAAGVVENGLIHLIGGGVPYLETTSQHLIYDPSRGWSFGPPLPVRREALGAGRLDDWICVFGGRLARGGRFNTPHADTYCLQVGSSEWILSNPLPAARAEVASVSLGGSVYAIGGHDANDVPQATVTRLVSEPREPIVASAGR